MARSLWKGSYTHSNLFHTNFLKFKQSENLANKDKKNTKIKAIRNFIGNTLQKVRANLFLKANRNYNKNNRKAKKKLFTKASTGRYALKKPQITAAAAKQQTNSSNIIVNKKPFMTKAQENSYWAMKRINLKAAKLKKTQLPIKSKGNGINKYRPKIYSRNSIIPKEYFKKTVLIHTGRIFRKKKIKKKMIGLRFGQLAMTRRI